MKSLFNIFDKQPGNRIPVSFHTSNSENMKTDTIIQIMMNNYRTMRCWMNNHLLYRI
ncbi:hypothetical protein D3C71_595680 [compost metagenome]